VFSPAGTAPSANDLTQDEHGAMRVTQTSGKYGDTAKRGNIYSAQATGLTPTVALSGTTSAPLVLYNPVGSGKRLKILKVSYGQAATGTLGTGMAFHCAYTLNGPLASQVGVIATGTPMTPSNMDIGAPNVSVATVLKAATLSVAAAGLYPFAQQGESVGGTTTSGTPTIAVEDVDGVIVLEPGAGYTVGTVSAAGSSPLVDIGIVWEEESLTT
jgi:hypothetical protein